MVTPVALLNVMNSTCFLLRYCLFFLSYLKCCCILGMVINQITMSVTILASHIHKNRIIEVKQLLGCMSRRVSNCFAVFRNGLRNAHASSGILTQLGILLPCMSAPCSAFRQHTPATFSEQSTNRANGWSHQADKVVL